MKAISALFLAVLLLAGTSLDAQEPAKEANAPADPFVKEKEKKAAPGGNGPTTHTNAGLVVQYIDVKRERWQHWLAENEVKLDATPLRKEVETWVAAGDAKLSESSLVMGKSGQRATVESVRFQIYPHEQVTDPSGQSFPDSIECRNVGTTTEVDLVLTSDGSVEVNFAPERVTYGGETPPREESGVRDGDIRYPLFLTQKATTQVTLDPQQWGLVGSETSLEMPESHQTLIFVRPVLHRFEESAANEEAPSQGIVSFTWVEMSHKDFNTSLMKGNDPSSWVGGGLIKEAEASKAEVIERRVLFFRSGQRCKNETISEHRYATEFVQSEDGSFATPVAWETRNVGVTVEIDPVVSPGGNVLDLNLAPEFSSFWGRDVLHRVLSDGEWEPNVTMPRFYTMQPITQLSLPLNVPVFVAAMSPPDDKGWTDPSRKVLLFVEFSH
ncbi:MAG: hypothetical protein KDN18_10820 [Verrucomicrobiae bacterium]|nr:hypothetical protein [Verrucomicrobiae bacterium]